MKRALVVGIDDYPNAPLRGCVNDANEIARLLERNGDGAPNFSIRTLTSDADNITTDVLVQSVERLFTGDAETVLFYFAGHGLVNEQTSSGYICTINGTRGAPGYALSEILNLANRASPRIKSTVIILDSCHSGSFGDLAANPAISTIGDGVTILTACHREQYAEEASGHGVFTEMLLDGLAGGAADVCGRITPASVYAHIDQTLGPWEQRPIYKANVQTFVNLREITPKVALDTLRRLPEYFPDRASAFALDPSYEPDRNNVPVEFRDAPIDDEHVRIFKELQACNRQGLVVPVDAPHMFDAAIYSKGCKLTALGSHYHRLAEMGRI